MKSLSLVCLGLGNFSISVKPCLQWIFFREFAIESVQKIVQKVNVYDPVFTQEEKQ